MQETITFKCLACGYVTTEPRIDHGYFHFLRCADSFCDAPVEQILPKNIDNVQVDVKIN